MNEEHQNDFNEWWDMVGSGTTPLPGEDMDEFAKRVAYRAYLACLENNDLD